MYIYGTICVVCISRTILVLMSFPHYGIIIVSQDHREKQTAARKKKTQRQIKKNKQEKKGGNATRNQINKISKKRN